MRDESERLLPKFNQLKGSGEDARLARAPAPDAPQHGDQGSWKISGEGQCHQARAEQHQAACGQRQKTVRYEVVVAHGTPAALVTRCSAGLIKIVRTSPVERGDASTRGRQALVRYPSNAWARKIPALSRPISAETVSIIANFRRAPCTCDKTRTTLHSQKDSRAPICNRVTVRIWRNSLSMSGTAIRPCRALRSVDRRRRRQPLIYHAGALPARSPFPPSSGCVIVTTSRRWWVDLGQ